MNVDSHLIFEAYRRELAERGVGVHIPSDQEIQSALERINSTCSVQDVKDTITEVIQRYKPTSDDDLKNGLYEDHQDISNHGIGIGKQRFPYKEHTVAEVAVYLANTKRMYEKMKERNARGENEEEYDKQHESELQGYEDAKKDISFNNYSFWDAYHAVKQGAWSEDDFHQWCQTVWNNGAEEGNRPPSL